MVVGFGGVLGGSAWTEEAAEIGAELGLEKDKGVLRFKAWMALST